MNASWQIAYSLSLTSLGEAGCHRMASLGGAGRPYGQWSLINITVPNPLSTVPHEPQDTGIRPFSVPRSRCWSGKRSTPLLPSASSICPRAGSRYGRATSIPRTVAPRTTPVGAMVSIAPSPMNARRVPANRHLSVNASRLSHSPRQAAHHSAAWRAGRCAFRSGSTSLAKSFKPCSATS